jgi:hypothetical protein
VDKNAENERRIFDRKGAQRYTKGRVSLLYPTFVRLFAWPAALVVKFFKFFIQPAISLLSGY